MENKISTQQTLLDTIKSLLPSNNSLAVVLSTILDISIDSAYRRIRCETAFTIDEIVNICNHFQISFDSFIGNKKGLVTFKYASLEEDVNGFKPYLEGLHKDLLRIRSVAESKIIYACQDIPIFHDFNFPELAAFKMYYWMKSIMNVPELQDKTFGIDQIPEEYFTLGRKIYNVYASIPSIEIWTETTIISTLKQVEFIFESGNFLAKEDALTVCNAIRTMLEKVREQAEKGNKIIDGKSDGGSYQVYLSEIEIANNCVHVNMGDVNAVYLGHLTFNTMTTTDNQYSAKTHNWFDVIIRKSTLISGVSEKHRYQYFRKLFNKLDALEQKINLEDL